MPGFDKTGPFGKGAMTGRRLGHCVKTSNADERGYGRGRGYRRGLEYGRNLFFKDQIDVSERTILENEIGTLKDKLASLEKMVSELNKNNDV
jgi:hypothetical protein